MMSKFEELKNLMEELNELNKRKSDYCLKRRKAQTKKNDLDDRITEFRYILKRKAICDSNIESVNEKILEIQAKLVSYNGDVKAKFNEYKLSIFYIFIFVFAGFFLVEGTGAVIIASLLFLMGLFKTKTIVCELLEIKNDKQSVCRSRWLLETERNKFYFEKDNWEERLQEFSDVDHEDEINLCLAKMDLCDEEIEKLRAKIKVKQEQLISLFEECMALPLEGNNILMEEALQMIKVFSKEYREKELLFVK